MVISLLLHFVFFLNKDHSNYSRVDRIGKTSNSETNDKIKLLLSIYFAFKYEQSPTFSTGINEHYLV